MITKKIFRKMFITSSIVIIILLIYLMPGVMDLNNNSDFLTTVEYVNLTSNKIYLMDEDGLLVETSISIIDSEDIKETIRNLLKNLSNASQEIIPNGLNSVMPSNIELLDIEYDEYIVCLNFSKEFLELDDKALIRLVEAISFTLLELDEINGVSIYIEEELLSNLVNINIPYIITRDFGINKKYNIHKTDNIIKYIVYYKENIADVTYYVPITKYVNSTDDKINIIIEDLTSNYIYQPNLISIANEELKLINYDLSDDEILLNFSNDIFFSNDEIKEEVIYPVINTIFSNYDVEKLIIQVNGEEILTKSIE